MALQSDHLNEIISRHNQITNLQVVFVDIEKYSQRRTLTQTNVIDRFMECLRSALQKVSQQYTDYAQDNDWYCPASTDGYPLSHGDTS
jgi:hypothetical protein